MSSTSILWLISALVSFIVAYFWYDKQKTDKSLILRNQEIKDDIKESYKRSEDADSKIEIKISELELNLNAISNKQTEHDNKFVTDDRVRDIVKSEIQPIKEDLSQVKKTGEQTRTDVHTMMSSVADLVTEFKVQNAMREYDKTHAPK